MAVGGDRAGFGAVGLQSNGEPGARMMDWRSIGVLAAAAIAGLAVGTAVLSQPYGAPPPAGDVFNRNTDPDGGGLPGEPAIDRYGRDPQCGGTDRSYYDRMYGTHGVVLSPEEANRDYARGEVLRCGACGTDQEICWLNEDQNGPRRPLRGGVQQDNIHDSVSGGPSYPPPRMVGRPQQPTYARPTQTPRRTAGIQSRRPPPAQQATPPSQPPVDVATTMVSGYPISASIPRSTRTGITLAVALARGAGSTSPWISAVIIVRQSKTAARAGVVEWVSVTDGRTVYRLGTVARF